MSRMHVSRARARAALALATASLLATGCSGPGNPLQVGVANVTSGVVVDTADAPPSIPLPPTFRPLPTSPAFTVPGSAPAAQLPAVELPLPVDPPALPCPELDLLASIKQPTGTSIPLPPAEHSYDFRERLSVGKAGAQPTRLALVSHRTVANVAQTVGSTGIAQYTYDVVVREGNLTASTTTTYLVVPNDPNSTDAGLPADPTATVPNQTAPGSPGLYITNIVSRSGTTVTSTFTPQPPMKLLSLPVVVGERFDVVSTDGQATIAYRASVVAKSKVYNACGNPVQAVQVNLDGAANLHTSADLNPYIDQLKKCIGVTGLACAQDVPTLCPSNVPCPAFPDLPPTPPLPHGADVNDPGGARYTNGNGQSEFTATYGIAPQYGGLSVFDSIDSTNTAVTGSVLSISTATINSVPLAAKMPAA